MVFRRSLLMLLTGAAVIARPAVADPLADGFRNPPMSARPRVWWHWMNGNITEEGIRLDLEWMKRIGIGGVQTFDVDLMTPKVVDKRLVFMTPEWKHAFRFAAQTADRLGLELAIAASPGWSESGGPWVTPADGMKKLVWSETRVRGGRRFHGVLGKPVSTTGPFQDLAMPMDPVLGGGQRDVPTLYRDIRVIAYRAGVAASVEPHFIASTPLTDVTALGDGRLATGIDLAPGPADAPAWLRADFATASRISSAMLALPPSGMFGDGAYLPQLETSSDGVHFTPVATFPNRNSPQYTLSFAPVVARAMRILFRLAPPSPGLPSPPAAGVDFSALGGFGAAPKSIRINEVSFADTPRVNRFEEKAGFALAEDYYALDSVAGTGVAEHGVVDLSAQMTPDGTLDWTPPPGEWRVLRFGYSLTGKENHPATREATGLEVDKYDAAAARRYIDAYLDQYVAAAGPDLVGGHGVRAVLNDSIEVGASNWTTRLPEEFRARRGYDLSRWMPALSGVVVGSAAASDKFLYDFRTTLAELIAEAHYGVIGDAVHKRGLIHYSEALESGRPALGDDMAMRRHADIPMAAMWSYPAGAVGPAPQYWGDIRGAASVAHVYGQNLVAAESLTSALQYWSYAPRDLKPMIDMEFALGVNRPVIHTSVHQPLSDRAPGLSLWIFGQQFSRLETWGEMARPWIDYVARSSFLLQQGRNVADVAYFYGEDAPITALYAKGVPTDLPTHNGFDYVNADVLLHQFTNDERDLVAKSGARYKLIYLGGTSRRMTLAVLARLEALARGGATIVGERPEGSPSLADDAAAFTAIADRLWSARGGMTSVGAGVVIAPSVRFPAGPGLPNAVDRALATQPVDSAEDYRAVAKNAAGPPSNVMFVHRKTADADIYYFTNRLDRPETVSLSFPIVGRRPERWDAVTGMSAFPTYHVERGGQAGSARTEIPLTLAPFESGFIVFRQPTTSTSFVAREPTARTIAMLSGTWSLSFQPKRGGPTGPVSAALGDWSQSADSRVRYFSGIGSYRRDLVIPAAALGGGRSIILELGEVRDVAEVFVNGKLAGSAWQAPYRVDISRFAKAGHNALEVRVANLWVNRLVGDAQPGARPVTFTTVKTYTAGTPLRPSGLLGPVRLDSVDRGAPRDR